MGEIDYLEQDLPPDDKDPKDYNYVERRREELKYIKEYMDPDLVPRHELAERYDLSRSQITRDFNKLKKYLNKHAGRRMGGRVKIFLDNIFEEIVKKKVNKDKDMSADDLMELYKFAREHGDWFLQLGRIEKAPDKHEIKHDADEDIKEKTDELIKLVRENQDEE